MSNYEFESRTLYEQASKIEDGKFVASRVSAVSYTYPGALSRLSSRCRSTVVYDATPGNFTVLGGTIEKWSDKGWQVIEEFFDTQVVFLTIEESLDYFLKVYKSFSLGLPIEMGDTYRDSGDPPPKPPGPGKDSHLRVLSFKDKFNNIEQTPEKPIDSSSGKDDSPDFDWI